LRGWTRLEFILLRALRPGRSAELQPQESESMSPCVKKCVGTKKTAKKTTKKVGKKKK